MHKVVFLINKKSGMDQDEFRQYLNETHSPIASRLPGLRKYVLNHILPDPEGNQPAFDGFVELWFDDSSAYAAALESPEGVASLEDVGNFVDVDKMFGFDVDEILII